VSSYVGVMAVEAAGRLWWVMDRIMSASWLDTSSSLVTIWQFCLEASLHRQHRLTQEDCCSTGKRCFHRGIMAAWLNVRPSNTLHLLLCESFLTCFPLSVVHHQPVKYCVIEYTHRLNDKLIR